MPARRCCSSPPANSNIWPALPSQRRVVVIGGCDARDMRNSSSTTERAVAAVLRQQDGLITRPQLLAAGWTEAALRYRTRAGGPWRAVLPGIYMNHDGPLSAGQREVAAVLYAGRDCVITGRSALQQYGLRVTLTDTVDVLIPDVRKLQSAGFVRTHRTERMPPAPFTRSGIRWAPVARAVSDMSHGDLELREVRAIVAEAVQHGQCTVRQLAQELHRGPKRGSGLLRAALEEVADGVRSAAEGDLRKLAKTGRLPEPMYNPSLFVGDAFLAKPDLWWPDAGVAGEVDSREWHLSPEQWKRTMARHSAMSAQGIIVLHFAPSRIRSEGSQVIAELRSAIAAGRRRPPLAIKTVPQE